MIHCLFSVYDSKVGAFMTPFFMRSKNEAIRSFTDIVNDGKSSIGMHPEDFCLFYHGTFSDEEGDFVSPTAPESLGNGVNFKRSLEPA